MLRRFKNNVIGSVGLLACLLIGGLEVAKIFVAGPAIIPYVDLPSKTVSAMVASQFVANGAAHQQLTYWLFLPTYCVCLLLFSALLWTRIDMRAGRWPKTAATVLALQMFIGVFSSPLLLYLVAAELTVVLTMRASLAWLAFQFFLVLIVALIASVCVNASFALIDVAQTLALQALAFGVGCLAATERRSRLALGAANTKLLATQLLLSDTVRTSERIRIARDLHDSVGHHLTALNLHLELAQRQCGEQRPAALDTSRELAHGLLAEVRSVVSTERRERGINLRQALKTLCLGIPTLRITLTFEQELEIESPAVAHAIFCCVQEAISNAVRHAEADALAISVSRRAGEVVVKIEDDGVGRRGNAEGNGLRGMRERLAELCGTLHAGDRAQRGFGLEFCLPLAGKMP